MNRLQACYSVEIHARSFRRAAGALDRIDGTGAHHRQRCTRSRRRRGGCCGSGSTVSPPTGRPPGDGRCIGIDEVGPPFRGPLADGDSRHVARVPAAVRGIVGAQEGAVGLADADEAGDLDRTFDVALLAGAPAHARSDGTKPRLIRIVVPSACSSGVRTQKPAPRSVTAWTSVSSSLRGRCPVARDAADTRRSSVIDCWAKTLTPMKEPAAGGRADAASTRAIRSRFPEKPLRPARGRAKSICRNKQPPPAPRR